MAGQTQRDCVTLELSPLDALARSKGRAPGSMQQESLAGRRAGVGVSGDPRATVAGTVAGKDCDDAGPSAAPTGRPAPSPPLPFSRLLLGLLSVSGFSRA